MGTPSQLLSGTAALDQFKLTLDRAFHEDAVGEVWATRRQPGQRPEMVFITDPADVDDTGSFEMIVVDSGNSAGDEWKYIYHPRTVTGVMIVETVAMGGSGEIAHMLGSDASA